MQEFSRKRRVRLGACRAAGFAALVAIAGCGGGEKFPTAAISGHVTIDGRPIAEGTIDFVPRSRGQGPSASAEILAGKYAAKVPRGPLTVYFQATRETGKMVDDFGKPQPERVNIIPERHRAGMPIEIAGDQTQLDFALSHDASIGG